MITFPKLPDYAAKASHIYWEPIAGSGERITVAVATVDDKQNARVVSLLSPEVLSVLYQGQASNAAALIGMTAESLRAHLSRGLPMEQWQPAVSGFTASPLRAYTGTGYIDIVDQIAGLHSSLYKAKAPQRPVRQESRSDKLIRAQVRDAARQMVGLRADEIFTPDGIIEVVDDGYKHHLDIPLKTQSKVGSIISAWYSSRQSVETHFLRAQSNLAVASERGRYQVGLFVSRPISTLDMNNAVYMDDAIDNMYWRFKRMGYHLEVAEKPDDLAREIIRWAA